VAIIITIKSKKPGVAKEARPGCGLIDL